MQKKFKEEEEAAIDDPWVNDVLIEKAGDMPIPQFQIPSDWNPSDLKEKQPPFPDVDNPGNWPELCYRPTFNKKGKYDRHKLPMGANP
eukprot:15339824-Ditylum_brightwellii.AAC.1